jgi:hypothetical protein
MTEKPKTRKHFLFLITILFTDLFFFSLNRIRGGYRIGGAASGYSKIY